MRNATSTSSATIVGQAANHDGGVFNSATVLGTGALYGNANANGSNITAIGFQAMGTSSVRSLTNETCVGNQCLTNDISGSGNTAIGHQAMQAATSSTNNTAVGAFALNKQTWGSSNTAVGFQSMVNLTTGSNNVAEGQFSLDALTTGSSNTALGTNALITTNGSGNVAIGNGAGQQSTGSENVFLGQSAGIGSGGSNRDTAIGNNALKTLATGLGNVAIGWDTASTTTTGGQNIALGYDIAFPVTNGSNQLDIGNLIFGTGINGEGTNISTGNVGIGTSTPYARLSVWGPDTASSTLALNIVNNASTTVFAVFDGGNAQLSGTLTQNSDARLKTNIQSLDASTSPAAINSLTPVAYDWLDPNKGGVRQYGFIAQQVQQVFPNLVSTTSATALTPDGTLGLNYLGLIAPLVEAVQALSADLSSLAARVSSLEAAVAGFANRFTTKQLCVEKSDGTPVCLTGDQLAGILSGTPSVQISSPTPPVISGTTTPPSFNIQGNNLATINVGDTYTDLGAIVHDNQGHDLSYRTFINGVLSGNILIDTAQAATDTIDYVATDTWGNTSTSTRTVIIEPVTGL